MLLLAGAACLAMGSARADEGPPQENQALQQQAVNGQWADVGTTGIGLAMGATEANPLGILTLGVKAYAYAQIKEAPLVEQPRMWSAYGAFGWGAAANNVCIIAAIASGGAAAAVVDRQRSRRQRQVQARSRVEQRLDQQLGPPPAPPAAGAPARRGQARQAAGADAVR
jgi:hypothetical protein